MQAKPDHQTTAIIQSGDDPVTTDTSDSEGYLDPLGEGEEERGEEERFEGDEEIDGVEGTEGEDGSVNLDDLVNDLQEAIDLE